MTTQEQVAMRSRLDEVLGPENAATLIGMIPQRDDVATKGGLTELRTDLKGDMAELRTELKGDMAELRTELKGDMAELRTELKGDMAELRSEQKGDMSELRGDMAEFKAEVRGDIAQLRAEMDLKFASKDDLLAISHGLNTRLDGLARTFVVTQVASIVGVAGIVVGLLQFL